MSLELMSPYEIIMRESMSDCSGAEMKVWESTSFGKLTELKIHGTWHAEDPHESLYIKATRPDGSIAFDGYGVDH